MSEQGRIPELTPLVTQTIYYWIVKETSTGFVIPAVARGEGGSHSEPQDSRGRNFKPRLFASEAIAKAWLTTWLKGKVTVRQVAGDFFASSPEPESIMEITPVASRRREFMEIKKVRIRL